MHYQFLKFGSFCINILGFIDAFLNFVPFYLNLLSILTHTKVISDLFTLPGEQIAHHLRRDKSYQDKLQLERILDAIHSSLT